MNMNPVSQPGHLASEFFGYHLPVEVLKSNAGHYIGTCHIDFGPISRESDEYWPTRELAEEALRNGGWTQRLRP